MLAYVIFIECLIVTVPIHYLVVSIRVFLYFQL